jgi:ATP-dependent DNA ligase
VPLLTRNGHDWTDRFGGVPQAARALRTETAVIDGEMEATRWLSAVRARTGVR